ncbi:MAG: hypothetical protein CMM87_01255 [Rickettsiales bacterium]|nr:hypothetical protein [Rickettsiales bacterium]|tara:strand:- start:76927 stop:77445 length:519 start_codon:yes stop_codon:yes gene_type:complete
MRFCLLIIVWVAALIAQAIDPEIEDKQNDSAAGPIAEEVQTLGSVKPTLDGLPQELFNQITIFLDVRSQGALARVSKQLHLAVNQYRQDMVPCLVGGAMTRFMQSDTLMLGVPTTSKSTSTSADQAMLDVLRYYLNQVRPEQRGDLLKKKLENKETLGLYQITRLNIGEHIA